MNQKPAVTIATSAPQERERVTEAVVNAVAAEEGVSPLELEPLATVVDPDALNALFAGRGPENDVTVEFDYRGFSVEVSDGGQVSLDASRSDR